jgi:hypothetical protein
MLQVLQLLPRRRPVRPPERGSRKLAVKVPLFRQAEEERAVVPQRRVARWQRVQ